MKKRSYYDEENKKSLFKPILILLFVIILIVIIFFVVNSFTSGKIENNLLQAGKDYYSSEDVLLPIAVGECSTVTLDRLLVNEYVKNETVFTSCDNDATYVKVCKLESGEYHYTPVINCGTSEDTKFGEWKEGNETNLIENKSDVRFSYLAQKYTNQSKNYYPNNLTDGSNINELYISAPSTDYSYKESGVTASKWYTEETGTSYWNNGAYSSVEPSGFPSRGNEGTPLVSLSISKPSEASYRTIKSVTLYRTREITTPYIKDYMCMDAVYLGTIVSDVPCESRTANNYNITVYINYTCDGENTVSKNSTCTGKLLSDWSTNKCEKTDTITCEETAGYQYTDKRWQWYLTGTFRKYYPSGASTSSGENTYYVDSPVSGAKKDEATTTTAYKFYKLVDNDDSEGQWLNLSDDYVAEDELIKIFNDNGFKDVSSLEEILKEKNIRYSIKLEYSNRE